jgi:hypothetical protein
MSQLELAVPKFTTLVDVRTQVVTLVLHLFFHRLTQTVDLQQALEDLVAQVETEMLAAHQQI